MKNGAVKKHGNESERLHNIIFGTDIGTWEWNVQTGETKFNEKWAEIIGLSLQDLGETNIDTWMSYAHPDDLEESGRLLNEHFDGKTDTYVCEARMKHKSGDWIWVLDKGRVVSWTEDGKPEWMAGSHQEITERKNKELLLNHYKNLLDRTNQAAMIGHWEVDLNKEHIFWSDVTKQIHEVDEAYTPTLEEGINFYPEGENREKISEKFQKATKGESYDIELQILTKTNKRKWVRAIGIPGNPGNPSTVVYGLFQDIDERVRNQKELELKEELFRKTFEFAAIGMALVGLDGKWLRVNTNLSEMLGYTKKELYAKSFQEITHPDDLNEDLELVKEMIEGVRDTYQMEKRYFHKDGSIVWALLSVSLVKNDSDEPIHFVSQINNITAKKAAEAESEKLVQITKEQNDRLLNFAHIVSHNLRSHAGNIKMILDLMKTQVPEIGENQFFSHVVEASKKLNNTVAHLNDVALMNTNLSDKIKSLSLAEYIADAIVHVQAQIEKTKAHVKLDIAEDLRVKAVPAYLESILLNFLTNALKYRSEKRAPQIDISAEKSDGLTKLTISDNGVGIDLEKHGKKLFGMYKTFHKHEDSLGIGLFITKNQIEAMGGSVKVNSKVGKGTTFIICLK